MNVTLTVDPTAGDAVIVLPNGAFVRTDQAITFTVPSNGGAGTRTDAIVAFVDPTGVASPSFSLTYVQSWVGGFTGNTANQWVVALISVAVGAVAISLSNITQNPTVAQFGTTGALTASDGQKLQIVDFSGSGQLYLQPVVSTPNYRMIVMQAMDSTGIGHNFIFDTLGQLTVPGETIYFGALVGGQASRLLYDPANFQIELSTPLAGTNALGQSVVVWNGSQQVSLFNFGNAGAASSFLSFGGSLVLRPITPPSDAIVFQSYSSLAWQSSMGMFAGSGFYIFDSLQNGFILHGLNSNANVMTFNTNGLGPVAQRIFTGTVTPTGATNGDIWINA
jgi:hypothetical protein